MGGAQPKVPTKPFIAQSQYQSQLKGVSGLVNHSSQWILVEMDRARVPPHWWKEVRAIKKLSMGSSPRRQTIWENLSKPKALHYAQWQAAAFRLPLSQQEASGWWDAPPWLCWLCPQDFLPHTNASVTRDFQTVRQEKTLALAQALQVCTARLGEPTRVLCDVAWGVQKCMASLMNLNGHDIVEASLLECTGEECGTSPTLEREAILLGEELEPLETPEAAASLLESPEIPQAQGTQ